MSPRRRSGMVRSAATILVALVAIFALSSCATKPKAVAAPNRPDVPAQAAPVSVAPAAGQAAPPAADTVPPVTPAALNTTPQVSPVNQESGGTALKTADPAALSRGREEREAIETSIVFGSPSSLAKARDLVSRSTALKATDAAALGSLALGVAALVYPDSSGSAPKAQANASSDVGTGLSGTAQGLLEALGEVAAGRSPEIPADSAGSPLGELIPALVLLTADSSDSARRAFDALDRFARLGVPSIIPSIIRSVDAERRGDAQGALGLYRSALAIAPDAWSATLGSGRALLALKRSAEALTTLSPLAAAHAGLPAFDRAYALALYANGRYSDAEPYVARVLTRDPQDSRFILIRAQLLLRAKAYSQALPLLDAYGTVDSSNRLYLLLRSLESEGLLAREEALKWARRGLASYPDDPELLAVAARLLFSGPAFGHEEARVLAARAVALAPPDAAAPSESDSETGAVILAARNAAGVEASRLLAIDAASRFKWADAAVYLARAGAALDDKALTARILRKSGNTSASLDYASAWYKAEPRLASATEAYLRALVDSGDDKNAQDAIARLLPGTISSPLRSILYFLQSKMQKSDEAALNLLHAALVENADNPEALAAVSDIQLRRKDYAKARFYLRQAMATDPGDPELEARLKQLDAVSPQ
jgi:tetratricopeptide (TPR) repeat protein